MKMISNAKTCEDLQLDIARYIALSATNVRANGLIAVNSNQRAKSNYAAMVLEALAVEIQHLELKV